MWRKRLFPPVARRIALPTSGNDVRSRVATTVSACYQVLGRAPALSRLTVRHLMLNRQRSTVAE
jgi:hypothetical protein